MAKYALVIGIGKYQNFRNLPKAGADAEAIAKVLGQNGYHVSRFPKKAIADNQWAIDAEKPLTSTDLAKELRTFLENRAAHQEVVIYFAGHGFRIQDLLTGDNEGFLATSDSNRDGQNAISFEGFNKLIRRASLSSLLLLLDCCHAGEIISPTELLQETERTINQKQNSCLIAACRDFEKAKEGETHGIFTAAVLRGLSSDRAVNGQITSTDLFRSVEQDLKTSGQEVVHAANGGSIVLIQYSTSERSHPQTPARDPLETALDSLREDYEILDQPFFEAVAKNPGRSKILHLAAATWSMLFQGNYIDRDQQAEALEMASKLSEFDGISLLLIRGEPGAGKTALMRWLAYELFCQSKRVFRKKTQGELGWLEQLRAFSAQSGGGHFYVITDDLFRDEAILKELEQNEAWFPMTLIGTTRQSEDRHDRLQGLEYKVKCLDLARPSEAEKERILTLPEVKTRIVGKSKTEMDQLMDSPIMLVLMLQLSEGKPFDVVLEDIVKNLYNDDRQPLYDAFGVLCCFFQYGISVPFEILRLCLPQSNWSERSILVGLEGLIDTATFRGFEGLTTVHQLIAETVMKLEYRPNSQQNQPYAWIDRPPLLERHLTKILQNIDPTQEIQKRWIPTSLRLLAINAQRPLVEKVLQDYASKLQSLQLNSSINNLVPWVSIYTVLDLPDPKQDCLHAIMQLQPSSEVEWSYWLSVIDRLGDPQQQQAAIAQTQAWLESHPDNVNVRSHCLGLIERRSHQEQQDAMTQTQHWLEGHPNDVTVRRKFLALVEQRGTKQQQQDAIVQTERWLAEHPDDTPVRHKFLGLIETRGNPKQLRAAIAQTQAWLETHPNDVNVRNKFLALIEQRGSEQQQQDAITQAQVWLESHPDDVAVRHKFLGLVEKRGSQEQILEALTQTQVWLEAHPDDVNVRLKYLVLVGSVTEDSEKIAGVIRQQWEWISQQQKVHESLWGAFLTVLHHHASPDLCQTAIECALNQHPKGKTMGLVIFGYFRDFLDYTTCHHFATAISQRQLPFDKWQNFIHAANFFRDHNEFETAEAIYRKVIANAKKKVSQFPVLQKTIDFASLGYAQFLLLTTPPQPDQALSKVLPILSKKPNHAFANLLAAKSYGAKGKSCYLQAIKHFRRAIQFDREKQGVFYHQFGCFYRYTVGDLKNAHHCFEESLNQKINLAACLELAELEAKKGNLDRAKTLLQQGLDLVPITRPEREERETLEPRIQALQAQLA